MQVRNVKNTVRRPLVPVNIVKNICNYTINMAPRTVNAIKNGKLHGENLAKLRNAGRFGTFCCKQSTASKHLIKEFKPLEVPVVMSALALPIPVGFISPAAFILGCAIISPIVIKKFLMKELTGEDIKELYDKLKTEDYVKLDKSIKLGRAKETPALD